MKNEDLTIPMVLGLDFLVATRINLDTGNVLYTLPATIDYQEETFSFLTPATDTLQSLLIAYSKKRQKPGNILNSWSPTLIQIPYTSHNFIIYSKNGLLSAQVK